MTLRDLLVLGAVIALVLDGILLLLGAVTLSSGLAILALALAAAVLGLWVAPARRF